jgi:ATP adenylyltransferase
MPSESIHAPWRIGYIRSLAKSDGGCFICDAAGAATMQQQRERLILWTSAHSLVVINRYPYTNGHLLIAPKAHKADLDDLTGEELADLQVQTVRAQKLLKKAMSPQGFNIGINIGRCAGAGLPGHVHQHIVPRWGGDTNFMHVVGEVQVVPQAISQLWDELKKAMEADE